MLQERIPQHAKLRDLVETHSLLRAHELRAAGIAPQTIARAVEAGELDRVSRGLYQRPNAEIGVDQALAETAKRIPKGVIAMLSALAFHGLTDQMPRRIWVAIGKTDWSPVPSYPPTRIVRLGDKYLHQGIEHHEIVGVQVRIYSVPKTLADLFRNSKLVDRSVAIEGLKAALAQRKAQPGAIAQAAVDGGAWNTMKPYLEALTSNG